MTKFSNRHRRTFSVAAAFSLMLFVPSAVAQPAALSSIATDGADAVSLQPTESDGAGTSSADSSDADGATAPAANNSNHAPVFTALDTDGAPAVGVSPAGGAQATSVVVSETADSSDTSDTADTSDTSDTADTSDSEIRTDAGPAPSATSAKTGGGGGSAYTCNGETVTIEGTPGDDVLQGTNGPDVFAGLGGNDIINGNGGDDIMCGGPGNDVMGGDDGIDIMFGEDGDDIMNGDDGNDTMDGGDGVDNIQGGQGDDTMHGGAGDDIMGGDDDDDMMFGDAGNDNMNGGKGNDYMDGGDDDDLMSGANGDDTLLGRAGADVLNGGPQFDTCDVGPGGSSATKCENSRPAANPVGVAADEDGPPVDGAFDATDPDVGDTLTFAIVDDLGVREGSVTNNNNGTFTFDPGGDFQELAKGETVEVTFTYTATDNNLGVSNIATVTVTVTGQADPITAVDDFYSTDADNALVVVAPGVLGNDDDVDGDATVVPIVSLPGGVNIDAFGALSYDPAGTYDYLGVGDFDVKTVVYTAQNTVFSDTATVEITINGVNDTPTANSQDVVDDNAVVITLTGTDPDLGTDLFFDITVPPTAGTLGAVTQTPLPGDVNTATVTYTPFAPGAPGELDQFEFTVDDGSATSPPAIVRINPNASEGTPGPDDPVATITAQDKSVVSSSDAPITVVLAANAAFGDPTNVDVADLSFSVDTTGTAGTVTTPIPFDPPDPDGAGPLPDPPIRTASVTFFPDAGFVGTTSFSFTVDDGTSGPATCDAPSSDCTAVVTVTVEAAAAAVPPQFGNFSVGTEPDTRVSLDLSSSAGQEDAGGGDPRARPAETSSFAGLSKGTTTPVGGSGTISEDPGDVGAGEPDLVSASVDFADGNLSVEVLFDPGTFNAAEDRVQLVLDTDLNTLTGNPGVDSGCVNDNGIIGADYILEFGASLGNSVEVLEYTGVEPACNVYTTATSTTGIAGPLVDGLAASVPLSDIGGDDGVVSFKVITFSETGPGTFTGVLDYLPDVGRGLGFTSSNVQSVEADVAWNVKDTNGDGLGDVSEPGPGAPKFVSAGVGSTGNVEIRRVHMEFPIDQLPGQSQFSSPYRSAVIRLHTHLGATDSLNTFFYVSGGDGDGVLSNNDFELQGVGAVPVGGAVMPVSVGNGTFEFDILDQLNDAKDAGFDYLVVQARVVETTTPVATDTRGLEIFSNCTCSTTLEHPQLVVDTGPITDVPEQDLTFSITSLPTVFVNGVSTGTVSGSLLIGGVPITAGQLPLTLGTSVVGFQPADDFTGVVGFNFAVTDNMTGLSDALTTAFVGVFPGATCVADGVCQDGRP